MTMKNNAFLYKWTDKLTDMYYIGSHKGTVDDGYVCSSKWLKEEYNKRPQDFIRQILEFGEHSIIRKQEAELLDKLDVKHDPKAYNQHNGNGNFYLKHHTEESKKRLSESKKGDRNPLSHMSPETRLKMIAAGKLVKGRIRSEESKQKYRQSKLGEKNPNYRKSSAGNHLIIDKTCKYCGKTMLMGNCYRWHDENCKSKPK